ncbi:hypothetical protein Taro_014826 [Colocasia esculenta]|uniref:Uncharacterized protein n=1 Tax=Colocasia esculenta TaxID=4460 RepID=A0A843UJU1_COLES|nr:hypothetical protein [Colocasia esculenta]
MKKWYVEDNRAPVLGGASVGGFSSGHQLLVLHLSLLLWQLVCIFKVLLSLYIDPYAIKFLQARVTLHLLHLEQVLLVLLLCPLLEQQLLVQPLCLLLKQQLHDFSDKLEPAQASQFITKTIQAHFSGPIYRFNDFPMEVQELLYQMFMSNHRFTRRSDEARSRLVWTMTARSNFKHLLYNVRKNAEKVTQSADPTLWRERGPAWMRGDYWETLCNVWAAERWQQTSTIMKVNRVANPEANMHTSGSVSFATHRSRLEKELKRPPSFQEVIDKTHKKKGTDQYISDRAREVAESYSQQMTEKYAGEEEHPQLYPEVWVAVSGAPKKGHVYGFGHSIDTNRVLSGTSSSASHTSAFTTVGAPGTSPNEMRGFFTDSISGLESRLAQTMETRLVQMQTQNARADALAKLASSGDIAPSRSVFVEELASPSTEVDVAAIEANPPAPSWMDPLLAYLLRDELPPE